MSNIFGRLFRISTFGESHGEAVGVIVDGCPAGVLFSAEDIQNELNRRRPGQSEVVTPRDEKDQVKILSGVFEGVSTGTPIMMMIKNENQKSKDYSNIKNIFRPSHADFTYYKKYGIRDYRGGGRSSARETVARVAAGALAQIILKKMGIEIFSYVQEIADIACSDVELSREKIEASIVRCPDEMTSKKMISLIKEVAKEGDTIGGVVKTVVKGVPAGLGEPVFDKLHAKLGQAMLSINAVKGFEYGMGFASTKLRGSEHNDSFRMGENGDVITDTNFSGGIQGGISNGQDIYFRTAFKPVATIMKTQKTVDIDNNEVEFRAFGRHDSCVLPRAVPIVDAMTALVLLDNVLIAKAYAC